LEPALLSLRNQTDFDINTDSPKTTDSHDLELRDSAINDDPDFVVREERKGWNGYVEWEDYPEKKIKAHARFLRYKFPPPPEFQLGPVPATNPVLEGVRWKLWHKAIGGRLTNVPEESWETVLEVLHHRNSQEVRSVNELYRRSIPTCFIFFNSHITERHQKAY
jgi:sulfite oxidase